MTVMEDLVVWLLAAYGCSSLLVMLADRWANRMSSGAERSYEHYWLLVQDSEQVVERAVRRLMNRSYWSGKPIRISLIDDGSVDDTAKIAAVYERYPYCWLMDGEGAAQQAAIVIDLRNQKEGA
jgi:hypothetical protein